MSPGPRSRLQRRAGGRVLGLLLAVSLLPSCAGREPPAWGAELTETELQRVAEAFPGEAVAEFLPLSEIFYQRITSRRFNSRATFEDPSVRQFFPTVAAYSDYYAALADDLDRANIRYNRPTRVELVGVDVAENGNLLLRLRLVGRNDLPLRWWSATLTRADEWTWRDGRWYVVPGKV